VSLPPVSLFFSMLPRPLRSTLFPYTTLFRSDGSVEGRLVLGGRVLVERLGVVVAQVGEQLGAGLDEVDVLAVALLRLVARGAVRSEEHTSELQSQSNLVCRLLLEKKNRNYDS